MYQTRSRTISDGTETLGPLYLHDRELLHVKTFHAAGSLADLTAHMINVSRSARGA